MQTNDLPRSEQNQGRLNLNFSPSSLFWTKKTPFLIGKYKFNLWQFPVKAQLRAKNPAANLLYYNHV